MSEFTYQLTLRTFWTGPVKKTTLYIPQRGAWGGSLICCLKRCFYETPQSSWIWYVILMRLGSNSNAWKGYMSWYEIVQPWKLYNWVNSRVNLLATGRLLLTIKAYHNHFAVKVTKTGVAWKKSAGTYLTPRSWMYVCGPSPLAAWLQLFQK